MAIVTSRAPATVQEVASRRTRRFSSAHLLSPGLLVPTVVAIMVFVYGFIGYTIWVSISNWRTNKRDLTLTKPFYDVYRDLFRTTRFQIDLRNTLIFTIIFLLLAVLAGLGLAILLDRHVPGGAVFRSIFLFPYALSFITTGVVWRWLFNPVTGVNVLIDQLGINTVLSWFGLGPFDPGWITDPTVWGDLRDVFPFLDGIKAQLGIPAALIPVTIAAAWQLSGFAMAMYLAGMGTISNEVREAAALDGASTWRIYRDVIIPLLKPITVSILIILGHVSLKIFDLIYAMSGKGPGFSTDVPGIFVYDKMFQAQQWNVGSAASIVMLALVSLVIVPYLARQLKEL
jgi:glucose/mannose transport system permease protein